MTTRPLCRRRHITVLRPEVRQTWGPAATPDKIHARIAAARADIADLEAEIAWLASLQTDGH